MAVRDVLITKSGSMTRPAAQLVRGDNNTCKLRLMMRREPDGVDLSGLSWSVNYTNADGTVGVYAVQAAETEALICGEWLIGGNATAASGKTVFHVEGVSQEDGLKVWGSGSYFLLIDDKTDGVPDDEVEEQLTPIQELIEQINTQILPPVIEAGETAKEAYQHPPKIGDNGTWLIWDWETGAYKDTGEPAQGSGGTGGGAVSSVNGKTGAVELTAQDVGALPEGEKVPAGLLPIASATTIGGIRVGGGLSIDENGVLKASAPIIILEDVQDVSGYDGETVTATVRAIGEDLKYEWWYKNPDMGTFAKSTAYTGNYCSIEMTEGRDGRQVYCIITDKYGNALRTRTATLTLITAAVMSISAQTYMPYFEVGAGLIMEEGVLQVDPSLLNCIAQIEAAMMTGNGT